MTLWQAFIDEFGGESRPVKVLAGLNDSENSFYGGLKLDALSDPMINPNGLRPDEYSVGAYVGLTRDGASPTLFSSELPADLKAVVTGIRASMTHTSIFSTRSNPPAGCPSRTMWQPLSTSWRRDSASTSSPGSPNPRRTKGGRCGTGSTVADLAPREGAWRLLEV